MLSLPLKIHSPLFCKLLCAPGSAVDGIQGDPCPLLPFVFGQWEALAGDGGREECEVRALTLLVVSRGGCHHQLCPPLLGPALRSSLLLGSGTLSLHLWLWA